jgi:ABC-type sulfate transport system permease component
MKKIFVATIMITIFLVVLIPFASSNPDGLEKVVITYGAQEHQSFWNGIMADYSFFSIGNQYVSTLLAGIFGVVAVLVAGLVLSKVMTSNHKSAKNNVNAR